MIPGEKGEFGRLNIGNSRLPDGCENGDRLELFQAMSGRYADKDALVLRTVGVRVNGVMQSRRDRHKVNPQEEQ